MADWVDWLLHSPAEAGMGAPTLDVRTSEFIWYRIRSRSQWANVAVLVMFVLTIPHTSGHKKYPDIEIVYKQLNQFSSLGELEEQVRHNDMHQISALYHGP